MAVAFEIKGKTLVKNGSNVLGQTSSDDQITVEEQIFNHEVHTSESGPNVPAAIYNSGRLAIITVPFVEWDQTLLDALYMAQGATDAGDLGSMGAALTLFSIQLLQPLRD